MANRVSDAEVQAIIDVEDVSDDMAPFITAANLLVTAKCSGSGYSTALLKEIERWLAAHFYAIKDPRLVSEKAGTSATYQQKVDLGFNVTTYGQQALLLDTAGNLAALNAAVVNKKGGKVGATWLGTAPTTTETVE